VKAILRVAAALVMFCSVFASLPCAQAEQIALYAESFNGNWSCYYQEIWPRYGGDFVTIYVVHTSAGATGTRFRLERSGGQLWWSYWWTTSNFAVSGNPEQEGITIDYGSCLNGSIVAAGFLYELFPPSGECRFLTPVAHADAESGEVEVTLCDQSVVAATGRPLTVNYSPQCVPWCNTVPVEHTTWGQIKALYRE